MSVPRLHKYQHKVDVNKLKLDGVEDKLLSMGYACNNCKEMIAVIDMFHLDESQFDFPYGSYEEFKKHVNAGKFDMNEYSVFATKEECQGLDEAVEEGKLYVTY